MTPDISLAEYLAAKNESKPAFARRAGVAYRTVVRACVTGRCGGRNAVRISRATQDDPTDDGRWVQVEALVAGREGGAA